MTPTQEAAMRQALEALGKLVVGSEYEDAIEAEQAITALRAALAEEAMQRLTDVQQEIMEPEIKVDKAEPVAWMVYTEGGTSAYVTDNPNDLVGAYRALALYTAAQPQRRPLTEEEIEEINRDLPLLHMQASKGSVAVVFARAIERAHGIGD